MFLSSFVIIQVMLMFSWMDRQQEQGSPVLDSRDNKILVEAVEEDLQVIDTVLFKLAAFLHLLLLFTIVSDFWPIISSETGTGFTVENPENFKLLAVKLAICVEKIFTITILWAVWGLIPLLLYMGYGMDLEEKGYRHGYVDIYEWVVYGFLLCWVFPVSLWSWLCYTMFGGFELLMLDIAWYCGILFSVFFCLFILSALLSRFPTAGVGLMLLEPDTKALDCGGFHLLTAFLHTVALSAIWYAFKYDPTGTVNPSWAGVLGTGLYLA
jgi:hypothetical protein